MVNNQYLYKTLPFDPLNDFSLVTLIAYAGHVLVVHPAVPARNVKELIALARATARQTELRFGRPRQHGRHRRRGVQVDRKVDIVHVPYKGAVLAVADVVGGQIEMVFSDMVPAVPQIRGGRLRALAVTTAERSPALPGVPTMVESGVKEQLPTQWWGIVGPKGMPAPIVARLNGEIDRIVKLPDVKDRYNDLGIMPLLSTPERMLETIRVEGPKMAKVLAAIGLKPE